MRERVEHIREETQLCKHMEPIVNQAWDERLAPRKKNGTAKGAPYNWFMSAKKKKHKAKAAWQRWESSTQKLVCKTRS